MIPPETANVGSVPGLPSDQVSCICGRRPGRPVREGEERGRVGQRTREMARSGSSRSASGGPADPAAHRGGRDGAATRLRHGAPSHDRVPFDFPAAGEGRGLVAGGRRPSPPSPAGRSDDARDAADRCPADDRQLDRRRTHGVVDPGRRGFPAAVDSGRSKAGTQAVRKQAHSDRYADTGGAAPAANGSRASGIRGRGARSCEAHATRAGARA